MTKHFNRKAGVITHPQPTKSQQDRGDNQAGSTLPPTRT